MLPTLLLLLRMAMQLGTRFTRRAHNKAKMKIQQGTETGTQELLRENTPVIQAKRQYSHLGWNQDGMDFYNQVKMGWKKLSSKNVDNVWTELEDKWMSYMEEIKYGNWKVRDIIKSGGGPQAEDMMTLPTLPPLVLEGDEDFKDDRPAWKKRTRLNPEENDSDADNDDKEEEVSSYSATSGTSWQANQVSLGSI
jgi:hypothetical protein